MSACTWRKGGLARQQLVCSMTHPCPIDAFIVLGNGIGVAGVRVLRPALEKLTNLAYLDLGGTCGDVQRYSTQCEQCARVGGGPGERVGQAAVGVVMVCSPVMCEGSSRGISAGKGGDQAMSASLSWVAMSAWWLTHSELCVRVCAYGEGAARFVTWRVGWRDGNYVCSITHLCPLILLLHKATISAPPVCARSAQHWRK